jgi:hypothetical protein
VYAATPTGCPQDAGTKQLTHVPLLDFGGVHVGDTKTLELVIANTGTEPVTTGGVEFGSSYEEWPFTLHELVGLCSQKTLAPGATCVYHVQFGPKSAGTRVGSLRFQSDASSGWHEVELRGEGLIGTAPGTPEEKPGPGAPKVLPCYPGGLDINGNVYSTTGTVAYGLIKSGSGSLTGTLVWGESPDPATPAKNVQVSLSGAGPLSTPVWVSHTAADLTGVRNAGGEPGRWYGLEFSTKYFYRYVVETAYGTDKGPVCSFKTPDFESGRAKQVPNGVQVPIRNPEQGSRVTGKIVNLCQGLSEMDTFRCLFDRSGSGRMARASRASAVAAAALRTLGKVTIRKARKGRLTVKIPFSRKQIPAARRLRKSGIRWVTVEITIRTRSGGTLAVRQPVKLVLPKPRR